MHIKTLEREVIFSKTVDWGQTLWVRSLSQGGHLWREDSEGKGQREARKKGKLGWGYVKGNNRTGGTTNKKKYPPFTPHQ